MKAIVQERYGPPEALALREVDRPAIQADQVLVRVRASSVHPDIWHVVTGRPFVLRLMGAGLGRPGNPIPGTDVAGEVEAVGSSVTRFRPGDRVFGETTRGYQWKNGGAYAEYVAVPEDILAPVPDGVTLAQAAAVPTSGMIALLNLPEGRLQPGQRVLVNGAGGGVGSIVVQLAKAAGATVTGVDTATKLNLLRSLGVDRAIDCHREDFTDSDDRYDLIVDIPGNHPFSRCRRVLALDGTYVLIGHDHFGAAGRRWLGSLPRFLWLGVRSLFVRHLPRPNLSTPAKTDLMQTLARLLEAGKLTPVIDRTYPLSQTPLAIRHLAEGHVTGKIIITV